MKNVVRYAFVCGFAYAALVTGNFYLLIPAALVIVIGSGFFSADAEWRWIQKTLRSIFKPPQ